jgi:hypothetical protein
MEEPEFHGPHEHHRHRDERPNLRSTIANLRGAGLPWMQVLAQVASNFGVKVATRRNCCGNYGQPGC